MAVMKSYRVRCPGKWKLIKAYDTPPVGWIRRPGGGGNAPCGFAWYSNGKSVFDKDYQHAIVKEG